MYRKSRVFTLFSLGVMFLLSSCTTPLKVSESKYSRLESLRWLKQYCANESQSVSVSSSIAGDFALKIETPEMKGQFSSVLKVVPSKSFFLEVTHLLGGTLAQISGDTQKIRTHFPGREEYDQSEIKSYLGIPALVLLQLFSGQLPCPVLDSDFRDQHVISEPGQLTLKLLQQDWVYKRSLDPSGKQEVPLSLEIYTQNQLQFKLSIQSWDFDQGYIKQAEVQSYLPDQKTRKLKWIWKDRVLSQ